MSDNGLANDLFGDSDNEAPVQAIQSPSPSISAANTPVPPPPVQEDEKPGLEDKPLLDDEDEAGADLFGDEDEAPNNGRNRESTGTPESSRSPSQDPLEYPEVDDEGQEGPDSVLKVNLPIPKLPRIKASDGKVWHLRLPNYVNIESKPFEPDYYRETLDDDATSAKDVNAAKIRMIGVRNTIRWRWVTGGDGQPLGQELFDVASSSGSTLLRPSDNIKPITSTLHSSNAQSSSTTFLATAAKSEKVLVTETSIAGHLSLQPTSMTSKTHMELVNHVGQQHVKHSRMKILEDIQDQEKVSALLAQAGRGVLPQPVKSKPKSAGRGGGGGGKGTVRRTRRYGTDSEEEASDTPRVLRTSHRSKSGREIFRDDVGVYDEDDGFVVADDDDDEEGSAIETEDSDEMAYGSSKKSSSKSKSKSKKTNKAIKRRKQDDEDEEEQEGEDEMERAERRIEAMEREKKKIKKDTGSVSKGAAAGASGTGTSTATASGKKSKEFIESEEEAEQDAEGEEDMEMDVESEDD